MALSTLKLKYKEGTHWSKDGAYYIASTPYGIEGGKTFYLYTPGYKSSNLPEGAYSWVRSEKFNIPSALNFYVLYNAEAENAFASLNV